MPNDFTGRVISNQNPSHKASIFHSNTGRNLSESIKRQWYSIKNVSDNQRDSKSQRTVNELSENDVIKVSIMTSYDTQAQLHDTDISVLPVDINSADTNIVRPRTTHYCETNLRSPQSLYAALGAEGNDQSLDNTSDLPFSERLNIFKYGSEHPNPSQSVNRDPYDQLPESLNFSERRENKQDPPSYSTNATDKTPLNSALDNTENLIQTTQKQVQELKDLTAAGTLLQLQQGSQQADNQGEGIATSTNLPNLSTATNPFYSTQAPVDQVSIALWPDFNLANNYRQAIGYTSDTQPQRFAF